MDYYTYADAVQHILLFGTAAPSERISEFARVSVQRAYRELAIQRWSYYERRGRLVTVAPFAEGSVSYNSSTRTLTLADATWPSWALYGAVQIGSIVYSVESVESSTELILSDAASPGEDLDAGTSYTLYRDTYPAPDDFLSADQMMSLTFRHPVDWMNPGEFNVIQRHSSSLGQVQYITALGHPLYSGRLAFVVGPPPSQLETIDYIYRRRPRALQVAEYSTGTASVTASGSTVTIAGGTLTEQYVGSIIRIGESDTDVPTGRTGEHAFVAERLIVSVDSSTQLTVDAPFDASLEDVKFCISDPVDVDQDAMLNYFIALCEYHFAVLCNSENKQTLAEAKTLALREALIADNKYHGRAVSGGIPIDGPLTLADLRADA